MTVLEQFSLFQRIAGSIKADVEEGKTAKALGKLEILEGELQIMRLDYEIENEEKNDGVEVTPSGSDFMNPPVDGEYQEIIDKPETEVIN